MSPVFFSGLRVVIPMMFQFNIVLFFFPAPFSAAKVQALLGFFGQFLCWPASKGA